ncbi:MAG TPA: FAD-binding oxidoreductase [Ilumatobacteraceae bacterium]
MRTGARGTARNYWSETAATLTSGAAVTSLQGDRRCDVVIVGGGFTAMWTAYFLKQAQPSLDVVVIEAQRIAHGASGRNGGFATTLLDLSHRALVHNFGIERARLAHHAIAESIQAIGAWAVDHQADIDHESTGLLTVATNAQARRWIEADVSACEQLGADVRFLEREQVRDLVDSPTYQCGFVEAAGALLNPAKLTAELARVVRGLGVEIYEMTPATTVDVGATPVITTPRGRVLADHVVLATNAYTAQLGVLQRSVAPMYSYILMTAPLTDRQWESVRWKGRQGIEDKRHFIHYYRPTADGRILWGGHDTSYYWRSGLAPEFDANASVFAASATAFRETFPQLRDVQFTHQWGGPTGVSTDFLPMFGTIAGSPVHYGIGYSGHGVAPSHTGGQILADLVLGRTSDRTSLLFVKPAKAAFPPEPLRWVGFGATRRSLMRQNRLMESGGAARYTEPAALKALRKLGGPR